MGLPIRAGAVVVAGALAAALFATPALAQPVDAPRAAAQRVSNGGWLLGDEWRYQPTNRLDHWFGGVLKRFLADLVAIPGNVPNWSRDDFALFTTGAAATLAFMVGDVPLDVQVQEWSHRTFGRPLTRFTVWQPLGDIVIYGLIWGTYGLAALRGLLTPEKEWLELCALVLEGFAVAEIYHAVPKLLLGREGPMNGEGKAVIWGPTRSLSLWPAGTPSGHAASTYAMMGAVAQWFDDVWLTLALQTFGFFFCAAMVTDDYHYVSDLIWGAGMGWSIGTWVVRHRSSRWKNAPTDAPAVSVLPLVSPRDGAIAVSVGVTF